MIVLDASVLLPALVASPDTPRAMQVVQAAENWIVPPLWQFEVTSALVTLIRAGALTTALTEDALSRGRQIAGPREVPVDQLDVVRLAVRLKISAYDAQYLALAHAFGTRCVTADRALARRAGRLAITLDRYVAPRP